MENLFAPLLSLGLPGVVIGMMALVIRALFLKYEESQTKRIEEGLKNQERLYEAIMALRGTRKDQ